MDKGQIPGLYYDPEKKRYFPIKANHQALGSASKYSLDNVRRRDREQQKRNRELARSSRLSRETVRRSSALRDPLSSGLQLQQSIGYRKDLKQPICDYYTDLFQRKTLGSSSNFQIAKFLRDPNNGDIYAGVKGSGTCDIWACSPETVQRPSQYRFDDASKIPLIGLQDGEITSISMHHSGLLLAAAGNYSGRTVQVTLMRMIATGDVNPSSRTHIQDVSTDFRFPGAAIWSTAANPYSNSPCFAVGVSQNLHIFGVEHHTPGTKVHSYHSDILALDWLNRNILVTGLNNSLVSLYDIRDAGSAMRVQHPHAVTNIRAVDDWRLIVAGRKSTLRMYDLRYASDRLQTNPKPTKKRHHSSPAYLTFPDYANEMPGPDSLDASPGLGLIATTDPSNRIQLFSLSTGKKISKTHSERMDAPNSQAERTSKTTCSKSAGTNMTSFTYESPITCLRFESGIPTRGVGESPEHNYSNVPSVLVSSGNAIDEWSI